MAEPLIIVDSDSKGEVFLEFYKQEAEITVVSSPPFQLSHSCFINEEKNRHDLTFSLTPLPSHKLLVKQLSKDSAREIFLAFDNDRPSEYICWLISSYLLEHQGHTGSVKRLDVAGLGHDDIAKAIAVASPAHPESAREFYVRILFNSTLARHLQRLVGFSKGPGGRSLNYATLTSIFLLVDREVEIRMFTSRKKWQILATLGLADKKMTARLECAPDIAPEGFVIDLTKGKEFVDRLKGKKFTVDKVDRSELRITPPSPYTLAELCHDSLVLYGIGLGKVLAALKKLYIGILIDGFKTGLISSFTSEQNDFGKWRESIRNCVVDLYGAGALELEDEETFPGNHILPLVPKVDVATVEKLLDKESGEIYELIRGRALASQMKDAVGSSIKAQLIEDDNIFQGHVNSITELGFLQAHQGRNAAELMKPAPFAELKEGQVFEFLGARPEETVGNVAKHYTSETLFADLAEFAIPVDPSSMLMLQGLFDHDYVKIAKDGYLLCGSSANSVASYINRAFPKMVGVNLSAYIEQTVTEVLSGRKGLDFALKQFDQTLMIQGKILVKAKVARKIINRKKSSSSRIIKHVVQQPQATENLTPFVKERRDKSLIDSFHKNNKTISKVLKEQPIKVVENETEMVDLPKGKVESVVPELEERTVEEVEEVETVGDGLVEELNISENEDAGESHESEELIDDKNDLSDKSEQRDKVAEIDLSTRGSEIPEIGEAPLENNDTRDEAEHIITDQHKECQICGRPMILKKDRFGKFWDCSGFPACRHSESYSIKEDSVMNCPLCIEGKLLTKRTPTGKVFYVCLDSTCEFMAWSKPHNLACLVCDSPYLVEKKSPQGRLHLRCPRAGCNYMRPMPGEDGNELLQEQKNSSAVGTSGKPKKRRLVRRVKSKGVGAAGSGKKKVRVIRRRK